MFRVTPLIYPSQYSHPDPLSGVSVNRNGLTLTLDKDSAAGKPGSRAFLKNIRKRPREYLAFGLPEPKPKPKRMAARRGNTCTTCKVPDIQIQVQAISQSPQEPDAGSKEHATVTIQILQDYLNIALGRRRYDEIEIGAFMTSRNLNPVDSIYFSAHGLTPEGRKLLVWLENAEYANGLSEVACDAFFTATANLTQDSSTALLIGARNLECALAWYCLPQAKQMTIMEFCAVNALSYSSLQKHFFGGGMLRDGTQERLNRRFGADVESIICMAQRALQGDADHKYVSAAGKVMAEWKALLLGCQVDSAMKRMHLPPIPSARPAPTAPGYPNAAPYTVSGNYIPSFSLHHTF
ncbi:MAG TPA: hypothetical protein VGM52_02855 [Herbaspirillum sp.]|jgi:hypothetical protein